MYTFVYMYVHMSLNMSFVKKSNVRASDKKIADAPSSTNKIRAISAIAYNSALRSFAVRLVNQIWFSYGIPTENDV